MLGGDVVGGQGLGVGDRLVAGPAEFFPEAVLGPDAGIIEARRDRVDVERLAVLILQDVAEAAVQDAGPALGKAGGVLAGLEPAPARLGADQLDLRRRR